MKNHNLVIYSAALKYQFASGLFNRQANNATLELKTRQDVNGAFLVFLSDFNNAGGETGQPGLNKI